MACITSACFSSNSEAVERTAEAIGEDIALGQQQDIQRAIQIVDLYHARQHLWELARTLYPNDAAQQKAWMKVHQKRLLDKGKIEKLVAALRLVRHANPDVIAKLRTEAEYFEKNADRMRYPRFSKPALVCWLRGYRGRLQNRYWLAIKAVRNVLDGTRRQRHPGTPLLPSQCPLRGLLGRTPGGVASTFMSRTQSHRLVAGVPLPVDSHSC